MTTKPASMDSVLCAMDAIDALRKSKAVLSDAASAEEKKSALRDEIRRIYSSQSIAVSDEVVEAGVEQAFAMQYVFKPCESRFIGVVGRFIVNTRLQKRILLGGIAAVALGFGANFTVGKIQENIRHSKAVAEANFEKSVVGLLGSLRGLPRPLEATDPVLSLTANELDAKGYSVTILSAEAAAKKALASDTDGKKAAYFEEATRLYKEAAAQATLFVNLSRVWRSIQQKRAAIAALPGGEAANQQADSLVAQGQAAVSVADFAEGEAKMRELVKLADDVGAAAALPQMVRSSMDAIVDISKDPAATQQAEALALQATSALEAGRYSDARSALDELRGIESALASKYNLVIVSRPGSKSGAWRFPNDRPNDPAAKRFYLIVEAVSPSGRVMPQNILSEETGRVSQVTTWGERVSEAEYESVKTDKTNDGVLQDNLFATKDVGYLTPAFKKGIKAGSGENQQVGRIISW